MDDAVQALVAALLFVVVIAGLISFTVYEYKVIEIENFQETINELSDEQKCIHICGFEFHSYFERYKFCLEKCDRISERTITAQECKQ